MSLDRRGAAENARCGREGDGAGGGTGAAVLEGGGVVIGAGGGKAAFVQVDGFGSFAGTGVLLPRALRVVITTAI
jgi:hypothetical protein